MPDPLPEGYCLLNFEAVLEDVALRYGDLLTGAEHGVVAAFRALPLGARRLYVRLLTRKGPWFRLDRLDYPEVGPVAVAADQLVEAGFCTPEAGLDDLVPLLVKAELGAWLAEAGIAHAASAPRPLLAGLLLGAPGLEPELQRRLRPLRPLHTELWELVFFLFFGNGDQDLSSFVLADTGRVHHEPYLVDADHRLFEARSDVDFLLSTGALRAELEEAATDPAALEALTARILDLEPHPGIRQQRRYHRLLNALGQAWERLGHRERALACYARSVRPPARERTVRLQAEDPEAACRLALQMAEAPLDMGEERFARRFLQRHARRVPLAAQWVAGHPEPGVLPEVRLVAARGDSVEAAALAAARQQGWEGFFAENALWNALFGLACWDILFAPLPGAFLHRFQSAPLDLDQPGFFERRRDLFEARLAEETLAERILGNAQAKWGVACAFVPWRALDPDRLAAAVVHIPPAVLRDVVGALARAPRAFSSGFPDLFLYRPGQDDWALWEVKGPGDTLRPEQERWLRRFLALGCDARVARLRYES
jgi:hypothetical protein